MKKILIIIFTISIFILTGKVVYAESFIEGKYINGEYIAKDKDGVHYYATMQFIKSKDGDIVYCLEPFVTFASGGDYKEISGDLTQYDKLSLEQKKEIQYLTYFGYGYKDRVDEKWYVITQYMIWKVIDKDANFYFTSTLNGAKVTKYTGDMKLLQYDVDKQMINRAYQKEYVLNYNESLRIEMLDSNIFEIVKSDYNYGQGSLGLMVDNVKKDGEILFRKKSDYYNDYVKIYDSSFNQDLIKPGNIVHETNKISVKVQKGDVTLKINRDDSVYSVESDFENTCYLLSGENLVRDVTVCTGDDNLVYKSDILPYGDYTVKQISSGIGYKPDETTYRFTIHKDNQHPVITINNFLIKNEIIINKYFCKDSICNYEDEAIFQVLDKNNNLVDQIVTNKKGQGSIILGYGSYQVNQVKGVDGYSLVGNYSEKIVDETSIHEKTLYNHYIKVEDKEPLEPPKEEVKEEVKEEPKDEVVIEPSEEEPVILEEVLPPNTGVDVHFMDVLWSFLDIIKKIICFIVI